jgi:signal transduction histidine kinase
VPYRRIRDIERLQALVSAMLLIGEDLALPTVLRTIVETAVEVVGARYGALGVLDETGSRLAEFVHAGMDEETVAAIGRLPEGRGMLGLLIKDPRPLRLADLTEHPERDGFPPGHPPMASFLGVPVVVRGEPYGNLYLTEKLDGSAFTQEDEDVVSTLGLAASLAIDKARIHSRLRDLTLVEERERIAQDLHDNTIRRLFAVGLTLQGARRLLGQPEAGQRLQQAIDELDDTIRQIRTTVFAITRPRRPVSSETLRGEILHLVEQSTDGTGLEVGVDFDGPIDDAVGRHAAEHLLLSVREALAAILRRPGVAKVEVELSVDDHGLTMRVTDDGSPGGGPVPELGNLAQRAQLLGGQCRVETPATGGMELIWRVTRLQ